MSEHFRFSPDILRRLGEELIPHVDQGIVELVRNAYDADALNCRVEIIDVDEPGGTLRVVDDGVGMTRGDIASGWLVLGRSAKSIRQPTRRNRLPVGDKGLGRLAALRLGSSAVLETRPKDEPGTSYRLILDWAEFEEADHVEDVPLNISRARTSAKPGTQIEVRDLTVRIGRREVRRLARSLLLLADPFTHSLAFQPRLIAPEFEELERRVSESYFDEAEFFLIAELTADGVGRAKVVDWKGKELWATELPERYDAPEAKFQLWVFILDKETFSSRSSTVGEVQDWLRVLGGVHIYHRNLRVNPYGDPGHDWLEMNLARVRSPELRPGTNTSIGKVEIDDPDERLLVKTDRSGFVENDAFNEIRRFCQDCLTWMARERLRLRERRRTTGRTDASRSKASAKKNAYEAIALLPPRYQEPVKRAVLRLERAGDKEAKTLREDLQLYRTLATVGTTSAVFAHESAGPVGQIERMAKTVQRRGRSALGDRKYEAELESPLAHVLRSAAALRSFAALPLFLLQKDKRRSGRVEVQNVITGMAALFRPFLEDARVSLELQPLEVTPVIRGSVAALEAIIANLLTNSVNAFSLKDGRTANRHIVVRTEVSGEFVLLRILDNGPGIANIGIDEIWLPGMTTVPGGTGLGLTIVNDSAVDLGGAVHVIAKGEEGGAEFVIELPIIVAG